MACFTINDVYFAFAIGLGTATLVWMLVTFAPRKRE
jgi:hypothetical protein